MNCFHIALLTVTMFVFSARQLTVQMMQNPQILAALQERLDGLNGSPSGYMERWDQFFFLVITSSLEQIYTACPLPLLWESRVKCSASANTLKQGRCFNSILEKCWKMHLMVKMTMLPSQHPDDIFCGKYALYHKIKIIGFRNFLSNLHSGTTFINHTVDSCCCRLSIIIIALGCWVDVFASPTAYLHSN